MARKQIEKLILLFCLSFFVMAISAIGCARLDRGIDVTSKIEDLGNPLSEDGKKGRALNVWDLQVFNKKIYLAGGSTIGNSGPINVWAYNPTSQNFEKEYTVDEEAIEHFKVFDNELYIPAADPRKGDANKFYRKTINGRWNKYVDRNITLAHVRDLLKTTKGEILMVGNNRKIKKITNPAIAITTDNGNSFQPSKVNNLPDRTNLIDYNWFFSIFSYRDKVYATSALLRDYDDLSGSIAIYNPIDKTFNLDFKLFNSEFIPKNHIKKYFRSYGIDVIYRIWNPIEYQEALVYSARSYSNSSSFYNKGYMNSLGFYIKTAIGTTPVAVNFPQNKSIGEDAIIIDNELYALANLKKAKDKFIIYVYKTDRISNKINWQEICHFESKNKARSFEYFNRIFYFGMGQDYDESIYNSGSILSFDTNKLSGQSNARQQNFTKQQLVL